MNFSDIDADEITSKLIGGKHEGEIDLTSDKECIYLIGETCTAIEIKATKDGKSSTKQYSITELNKQ